MSWSLLSRFSFFIITLLFSLYCYADRAAPQIIPHYNMQAYDRNINYIYATILKSKTDPISVRIAKASEYFLGKPYLLNALGEGIGAQFDKDPLYRTDKFDCVTYVEIVLALAEAHDLAQFKQVIKRIRYQSGLINYFNRNHFINPDWNVNNTNNHYLQDITDQFPIAYKIALTKIDKPHWYKKLTLDHLKLFTPITATDVNNLLNQWQAHANQISAEVSEIKYLPLSELFINQNGNLIPNSAVFAAIPSGSIIEIIQPNPELSKKIGTDLDVQHMGFAIRTSQGLMFREASSYAGRVIDVPLTLYLSYYHPGRMTGINIEVVH